MRGTATKRDETGAYVIGIGKQKNSVKPSEVMYVAGERNYSGFVRRKKPPVLASISLIHYERYIPEFVRIHKQYLVNPAFVKQVVRASPDSDRLELELKNGERIPVSRRRLQTTRERLLALAKGSAN